MYLKEVARLAGNEDHYAYATLGASNRFYAWSLPTETRLDVAQRCTVSLSRRATEILKDCLPRLEERARPYKSGGSADEKIPRGGNMITSKVARRTAREFLKPGPLLHQSNPTGPQP